MKPFYLTLAFFALLAFALAEPQVGKHAPYSYNGPKNGKQVAFLRGPNSKQKTLVVQIRSDQPVPLVLKGRPAHGHTHAHAYSHAHHMPHSHVHHHINAGPTHIRGHQRPIKLMAPQAYMKNPTFQRKPLKIKLANTKTKLTQVHKPATSYDVPFKYEIPSLQTQSYSGELQQLPLQLDHHIDFISDHFAPIHTIPAPNLSIQDNHLRPEETYLAPSSSPKPQVYHQQKNNYKVVEDSTNDQTVLDPVSGSQKLIAPDPDPSLPAAPVRPATEPFNTPSNGKPLPVDIQSNHLTLAQPLVQIVGAQAAQQLAPQIYPVQYTQPFAAAPVPIYNPTYLVQQSNNLYTQHKQQLFKPAITALPIVEAGYVNADLTQEVASNGQILQAAKDPHNNIHPVLDIAPHFAPLIAAPSLDEERQAIETAPFHLQNIGGPPSAISSTTEPGFVVSNYFGNAHQDSSQLLQAYVEEEQAESQRQQYEQQLQQQQQQLELQQLQQQQQQLELQQLQQYHQQQQQYQQQQQQFQQQQQQHQQQQQYTSQPPHHQHQALVQTPRPQQHKADPAAAAFEEHQRLVQQQLGADTPLRIFVPDEEEARLQKRSDNLVKGSFEDVENTEGVEDQQPEDELYEVSSSVEVSNEDQQQQQQRQQKRHQQREQQNSSSNEE